MSKKNSQPIRVGSKVAFNTLDDATWFRVVEIEGFRLIVREFSNIGIDYAEQPADISMVKQVKN